MARAPAKSVSDCDAGGTQGALEPPVLVSIVLPTRNRTHVLGRALHSVLAQTVEDFEVLVVDEGSTDDTADVLATIPDRRVRSVRLDDNVGVSRARNVALALARGQWIAFLDDDDEWAPTYLERQLEVAASRPDAEVIYCRARRRNDRTGEDVGVAPTAIRNGSVFRYLVSRWNPGMSCTMVRRSRLLAVGGFDEQLRVVEDCDLWLRLAQQTDFAGTADVLVVLHENLGEQLSGRSELYAGAVAILERRWGAVIEASCGRTAYRRWRTGLLAYLELIRAMRAVEAGRRLEAAYCAGRMLRLLPWSIFSLARALAFAVLGPRRYGRLVDLRERRASK